MNNQDIKSKLELYKSVALSDIKTPITFEEFKENLRRHFLYNPSDNSIAYTDREGDLEFMPFCLNASSRVDTTLFDISNTKIVPLIMDGEIFDRRMFRNADLFKIDWLRFGSSITDISCRDIYTHILGDFICFDHPDMDVGIRIPPSPELCFDEKEKQNMRESIMIDLRRWIVEHEDLDLVQKLVKHMIQNSHIWIEQFLEDPENSKYREQHNIKIH